MKNESIRSLIEFLVRKSGFDINKKDSEQELEKTIKNIAKYENELNTTKDDFNKLVIKNSLESLKVRKNYWENNAEVIGRNLYTAYKNGASLETVRPKIEKLAELALSDEKQVKEGSLMSFVYSSIKTLEEKLVSLTEKINTFNYKDETTVELDKKMQGYLKEKTEEMKRDLTAINSDLNDLREVESRDVTTLEKVKEYISNTTKDLNRLKKIKEDTLYKEVSTEIWDKLEHMIASLTTRIESAQDTTSRLENSLEDARKKRHSLNERKKHLDTELKASEERLSLINERISRDNYVDTLQKVIDLNNKELLEIKLNALQNKKEVIYINVEQVKNELITEWSKPSNSNNSEEIFEDEFLSEEKEVKKETKKIESYNKTEIQKENDDNKSIIEEVAKEFEEAELNNGKFKDVEIKENKSLEDTKYEFEW